MNKDIIIFGNSLEKANKELDRLLSNIPSYYIKNIIRNEIQFTVEQIDGTKFSAMVISPSVKGFKCNLAIIDKDICYEDIYRYVEPCITGDGIYIFY